MATPTDAQLRQSLTRYDAALETRAKHGQRSADLVELDSWRRTELKRVVDKRVEEDGAGWVTVEELGKLMDWKMAHGKWRPRLQTLVRSNPPSLVKHATSTAHAQPPATALQTLSTLKAIGPATASALLALWHPATQPFLSDEAHAAVGLGQADYTPKGWARFVEAMQARAEAGGWAGVDELERAMWAWGVEERWAPQGDPKTVALVEKAERKKAEEEEVTGDGDEGGAGARVAKGARKAGAKFGGIKRAKGERDRAAEEGEDDEDADPEEDKPTGAGKAESGSSDSGPARGTRSSKRNKEA